MGCLSACVLGGQRPLTRHVLTPFTDGDADVFEGCCSCPVRLVVFVCVCCREQEDREERERLRKEGKPLPPELLREGGLGAVAAACFSSGVAPCQHPADYLTGLRFTQQMTCIIVSTSVVSGAAAAADTCPDFACCCVGCCRGG